MTFLIAVGLFILLIVAFGLMVWGENRLPKRPKMTGQRFFKREKKNE